MESKQIRVHEKMMEKLDTAKWEIKYKLRIDIQDYEVLNALLYKHLKDLTEQDVLAYRKDILGKED
jgi:hypothetical protein